MAERASPRMMGRRGMLLGALPGILLIAAFTYLALGAVRLEESRALVNRTFNIMFADSAIYSALQDADRGQRGYLLTGDPQYLGPYERGTARLPDALAQLNSLAAGDPDLKAHAEALQHAIDPKLVELKQTIALRKNGSLDAAMAVVNSDVGEKMMRDIGMQVGQILRLEQTLLGQRLEASADSERNLSVAASVGGGLSIVILAWIAISLYRSHHRASLSEKRLQATLDAVREGVAAFDYNNRLVAWNKLFIDLLRLPAAMVRQGLSLSDVVAFKDQLGAHELASDLATLDERSRRAGKPLMVERERDDKRLIEIYHNPLEDGGFVTTFIDMTDRRHAERAARQAQKMESLGQMTGGIAHDFNNLLTIIVGNLDLLKAKINHDERALRNINLALMGAERGAKLTHQLLAFARRQPLEPRPVNLGQLLPDLTELLRRSLGELIDIEVIGAAGLWNTSIDPHQFENAVLNLAINARDAMPNGGRLTLELANVWVDEAYAVRHEEVDPGQYVMFGVTDTGSGMPPEIAARAFDPFFTTKGDGGTGLGLSMVYGFVKQSGGHVKIYSEPGHGTTVKIYLPRTMEMNEPGYVPAANVDLSGSETILVVEDDDTVRSTVVGMLADLGYRVLEAANGASALTALESGEPVDLVFTDVIMPGSVSSRVLAERARELRPGIKILFTSGYTENTIVHNGRLDPGVQLISKPYGREQLAQKIRSVLARSGDQPKTAVRPAAEA
ncbi:MAG TPA: CHASE3 domain-containing protein [Alphaproteobacteria bacterium]|nr:CHASE3 domain-containing protein [Alphaproteobacteria bacterium]